MAINTIQGFNPSTTEPIDSRVTVANETARLAFATFNVYEGLVVYQEDTDELYVLNDAANPDQTSSWSTVGGGSGFPFTGSASISGSLDVVGNTYLQDAYLEQHLYHAGDTNTYLRFDNDQIRLVAANYTVFDTTGYSGTIKIGATNNPQDIYLQNDAGVGLFLQKNTGNIGIGTTTPSAKLDVVGDIKITGSLDMSGSINLTGDRREINILGDDGQVALKLNDASTGATDIGSVTWHVNGSAYGYITANGTPGIDGLIMRGNTNRGITFQTNGANTRMRIQEDGNVGIGTTSPGSPLTVAGRVDFQNDLRLRGTDSAANQGVTRFFVDSDNKLHIDTANDGNDQFVIDSSGKVGIGTTSPYQTLTVAGNITQTDNSYLISTRKITARDAAGLSLYNDGGQGIDIKDNNDVIVTSGSGNVGIGTTAPSYDLTVYGSPDSFPIVAGAGLPTSDFVGIGLSGFIASNGAVKAGMVLQRVGNYGTGDIHFLNNSTEDNADATLADSKVVIKESGNVGIGTTSPQTKLHLSGSTGANSGIRQSRAGVRIWDQQIDSSGRLIWSYYSTEGGTATQLLTLDDNNKVGIGTTSPAELLDVDGTARAASMIAEGVAYAGSGFQHWGDGGTGINFPANDRIDLDVASTTKIRITDDIDLPVLINPASQGWYLGSYNNTSTYADIGTIINGSTFGGLITGPNSGHLVVRLQNNDTNDSFAIVANSENSASALPDKVLFRAKSDGQVEIPGDLTVTGKVTAQEFHTEFVSASIVYSSGSTKFGDTADDVHSFTGSLQVLGAVNRPFSLTDGRAFHKGESGGWRLEYGFKGSSGTDRGGFGAQGVNDTVTYYYIGSNQTNPTLAATPAGNVGIGTTSPSYKLHVNGTAQIGEDSSGLNNYLYIQADTNKARYIHFKDTAARQAIGFPSGSKNLEIKSLNGGVNSGILVDYSTGRINIGHTGTNSAVLHIKGEGSNSATTAFLVQNAAGADLLKVVDDGQLKLTGNKPVSFFGLQAFEGSNQDGNHIRIAENSFWNSTRINSPTNITEDNDAPDVSAMLQVDSTTKGFLPPRMTTTQINNISEASAGLIVYDTTINNLKYYDSSSWSAVGNSGFPFTGSASISGSLDLVGDATITGNVGIGTTNPTGSLQLLTPSTTTLRVDSTNSFGRGLKIETNGLDQNLTSDGGTFSIIGKYSTVWEMSTNLIVSQQYFYGGGVNFRKRGTTNNLIEINLEDSASPRMLLKGSGTTSATTALQVEDSSSTFLFGVLDDGRVKLPTDVRIYSNTTPFIHNGNSSLTYPNVFIGDNAGNFTSTGTGRNVGIGQNALQDLTTGLQNTGIGWNAGKEITEGTSNTFIGAGAGQNVTTGDSNFGIGAGTLPTITTDDNNVGIGTNVFYNLTSGTGNIGIGYQVFNDLVDGDHNIGMGTQAGRFNQGRRNVSIGYYTLVARASGSYNTIVGYRALQNNTEDNNVAIGYQAGRSANAGGTNDTGSNSVFLGYQAYPSGANDTNEIVIGYQAVGLGSNTAVLGNDSITTTALKGNIGIGTTTPASTFHVDADNSDTAMGIRISNQNSGGRAGFTFHLPNNNNQYYSIGVDNDRNFKIGENNLGTNTRFMITPAGNVGIGTTSPVGILHAYSTLAAVFESPSNAAIVIRRSDNVQYSSLLKYHSGNSEKFVVGLSDAGDFTDSTGEEYFIGTTKTNPLVVLKNDGKLGIGTTSPTRTLEIGTDGGGEKILKIHSDTASSYFEIQSLGNVARLLATNNTNLLLQSDGSGGYITFNANSAERMRIAPSGNVGIGTTSPTTTLDVRGTISQVVDASANQYPLSFYNDHSGTDYYLLRQRVVNSGNQVRTGLGITGAPDAALVIGTQTDQILKFSTSGRIRNVQEILGTSILEITGTDIRLGDGNNSQGGGIVNIVGASNKVPLLIQQESGSSQDRFITFLSSSGAEVLGITTDGGFRATTDTLIKRFSYSHAYSGSHVSDGQGVGISFITDDSSNNLRDIAYIDAVQDDISEDESSLRFSVGETTPTEVMRLQSDGNVGIGTASPSSKLQVQSAVGNTQLDGHQILLSRAGNNHIFATDATGVLALGTNNAEKMRIDSAGNVGIGTTSPGSSYKLDVEGNTRTNGYHVLGATGDIRDRNTHNQRFEVSSTYSSIKTSNTHRLYVTSTGNVGIGTTSPSAKLHVTGSGEVIRLQGATGQSYMTFHQGTGGRVGYLGTAGSAGIILESSNQLQLYAGSLERMRIDSTGNVGIGTTLPSEKLEVRDGYILVSGSSTSHGFELARDGNDTYQIRHLDGGLTIFNSTDARKEMTFKGDGFIGIGTTAPTSTLHVSGTADVFLIEGSGSTANTSIFAIDGNNGRLFEVSDDLSDSLFSVNTIAGLPVMEVFSDNRVIMGAFNQNDLVISGSKVGIGTDSPSYKLDVSGSINHAGASYIVPATTSGASGATTVLTGATFDNATLIKASHDGVTTGDYTLELPAASSSTNRTIRIISDSSTDANHNIIIAPTSGDTLDGGASGFTINRNYEGLMVWSDGSEWYVIQSKNV